MAAMRTNMIDIYSWALEAGEFLNLAGNNILFVRFAIVSGTRYQKIPLWGDGPAWPFRSI